MNSFDTFLRDKINKKKIIEKTIYKSWLIYYKEYFYDLNNENNEFDHFIDFHLSDKFLKYDGSFSLIKYNPSQSKYHDIQKKQYLMEKAISTNNYKLVKYIYDKYEDIVFCEKHPTPDFELLNVFTLTDNIEIIRFLHENDIHMCYYREKGLKYKKYAGVRVIEEAIYKDNQKLVDELLRIFNIEIKKLNIEEDNSINFDSNKNIDLTKFDKNKILDYLY